MTRRIRHEGTEHELLQARVEKNRKAQAHPVFTGTPTWIDGFNRGNLRKSTEKQRNIQYENLCGEEGQC